ncbi:DNA-3-methyladenine glycosylase I [Candidatus Woesearchaeota archaeon]|jgi:DNA-3-methyladenine glycosylase I|nr:DNA-3-methyladenine glycosylase I [Candidatus Woesearchaeota archaeon]
MVKRCKWATKESQHNYHDQDWGVPVHNDRLLFEMLILEGAQAGLSWDTILKRRETYKKAYDNFNAIKIVNYTDKDKKRLLADPGIIRNKLKVEASIINAKEFLKVKKEFGSFDKYIWSFVNGKTIKNKIKEMNDIPVTTKESDAMAKDLKKRGFKFVGSTICYAYMQAVGMVNDHEMSCFRYEEV